MTPDVACPDCVETDAGLVCQSALGGKCPDRVSPAVPGRMSLAARLAASPEYRQALADAESGTSDGPGAEAREMIDAATERRRLKRPELSDERIEWRRQWRASLRDGTGKVTGE